mmetsp:Transcript_27148/g.48390  ORF Transcript_27148/g.48390 Transcript_27148/m.48390 type:complete len:208 (+) Transcript_27148:102-725(+)
MRLVGFDVLGLHTSGHGPPSQTCASVPGHHPRHERFFLTQPACAVHRARPVPDVVPRQHEIGHRRRRGGHPGVGAGGKLCHAAGHLEHSVVDDSRRSEGRQEGGQIPHPHLLHDLLLAHTHKDSRVVQVHLHHAARLISILVLERVEVEKGAGHAVVDAPKDVGGRGHGHPSVQPQPHSQDGHPFEVVHPSEDVERGEGRTAATNGL